LPFCRICNESLAATVFIKGLAGADQMQNALLVDNCGCRPAAALLGANSGCVCAIPTARPKMIKELPHCASLFCMPAPHHRAGKKA
jgi:hypothetical protein